MLLRHWQGAECASHMTKAGVTNLMTQTWLDQTDLSVWLPCWQLEGAVPELKQLTLSVEEGLNALQPNLSQVLIVAFVFYQSCLNPADSHSRKQACCRDNQLSSSTALHIMLSCVSVNMKLEQARAAVLLLTRHWASLPCQAPVYLC